MRRSVLLAFLAAGCVQAPSVLRSADLSGVTTIAVISKSGSATAVAALEEELRSELPSGHRFALVPAGAVADATLAIDADRWWVDERDTTGMAMPLVPSRLRRVETMEATFHLAFGPNAVSETYRRTTTAAARAPDASLWNDDLLSANAVQIIGAFMGDLQLDEHGVLRPARPAPVEAPPGPPEAPPPL
jgi:hypothetical protein